MSALQKSTLKDQLSIIFSVVALTFTALNFWWSNLRVENAVEVRSTGTDMWIAEDADGRRIDTAVISVAFINKGNRQAILLAPRVHLADRCCDVVNDSDGPLDGDHTFPFTLEPHQLKQVLLKVSLASILFVPGAPVTDIAMDSAAAADPIMKRHAAFEFVALDSEGKVHRSMSPFDTELRTDAKGLWDVVQPGDDAERRPVRLFGQ